MKRKFVFTIALQLPLVLFTGCASKTFPIKEAVGATASKVRFSTQIEKAWIDLYPSNDCNNGVNVVFDNFISSVIASTRGETPKRVGMIDSPDPALRNSAEYSIQGGQIINVGVGGAYNCLGGRSFVADAGKEYEVVLKQGFENGCFLSVNSLSLKEGAPWRTPVKDVNGLICKSPN